MLTCILRQNAEHCAWKYHIPKATIDPTEIFKNSDVDVVFISVSDEFHEPYAIAALEAQKHVFIEKPITLSLQSAQRIIDAEKKAQGRVWVGYMRRHSRSFTDAFKRELESIPKILYARSRDFSGRESRPFEYQRLHLTGLSLTIGSKRHVHITVGDFSREEYRLPTFRWRGA